MINNSRPKISITPTGNTPPVDMGRIVERIKRVKASIANPGVGQPRRAKLQEELILLQEKINMIKAALNEVL